MKYFYLFLMVLFATSIHAQQTPTIVWQKNFGGTRLDNDPHFVYNNNELLWVAAYTASKDHDVTKPVGKYGCYWFLQMDTTGYFYQEDCYGADHAANIRGIVSSGNEFIMAGEAYDGGADVSMPDSLYDYWSIKIDRQGNKVWDSSYGGTQSEKAMCIAATKDGGLLYAGQASSNDGDVVSTNRKGMLNYWLVKTDSTGVIEWQNFYGDTTSSYWVWDIHQLSSGDYILCGGRWKDSSQLMVAKLDDKGNEQWTVEYGSDGVDEGMSIALTKDGGFIVVGTIWAGGGDVTRYIGKKDIWVVKLDSNGGLEWEKTYGGTNDDLGHKIIECMEGGYLFVGGTHSYDVDVVGNHSSFGSRDGWVVKLDDTGRLEWQKCLGGPFKEWISEVVQLPSGSYILGGAAESYTGDLTGNYGDLDLWILMLNNPYYLGVSTPKWEHSFSAYPNPANDRLIVSTDRPVSGELQLLDMQGKVIKSIVLGKQAKQYHIDVQDVPAGNYYIRITSGDKELTKQLTIVH